MSDLISRQAAISRAVTIPMFGRNIRVVGVSELENLPSAQPERRWIPVTERLPEDGKDVLLTEEVRFTDGRRRNRVCTAYYDSENQDWLEIMGEDVEIVSWPLAWMPLPEPYKEGEQDD